MGQIRDIKKIESFKVDHQLLEPGIYARVDLFGKAAVTTFDIRMCAPYREPVMPVNGIHAIEHLGATFLRNHKDYGQSVVYFGPMGCRTGFYLLLAGKHTSEEIVPLMIEMFEFISNYEGDIPGANMHDCGNCLEMSLKSAKEYAKRYLKRTLYSIDEEHMRYPA